MDIRFTKHALEKFAVLRMHGVRVSKSQVLAAIRKPSRVDYDRLPLLIAQADFDKRRVLRVVYKAEAQSIKIITFYPGRKTQYEKE